jgi:hypothetical protein
MIPKSFQLKHCRQWIFAPHNLSQRHKTPVEKTVAKRHGEKNITEG